MKIKLFFTMLIVVIILAACGNKEESKSNATNETQDIKELVQDFSLRNKTAESASITSTQLIVKDDEGKESVYDLPEDEFFVSIAPFIKETHPCTNHSLTGCQGELVDKDFDVYIEDTDGNVVVDKTFTTMSNGFIDLWLPRDKTFNVKIEHEGKSVEQQISTFEKDGTCITTMQLM